MKLQGKKSCGKINRLNVRKEHIKGLGWRIKDDTKIKRLTKLVKAASKHMIKLRHCSTLKVL